MDESAAASLLAGFLNSREFAGVHPDLLGSDGLAGPVFRALGTDPGAVPPGRLAPLRRARAILTSIISDDTGPEARDAAWDEFSGLLSPLTFRLAFGPAPEARLEGPGGEPLAALGLAVADLVNAGAWSRVRLCANPGCRYAFFDTTRSRTRRWHSYDTCGNRLNVAAHRAARAPRG
jgi:hypothetical protein